MSSPFIIYEGELKSTEVGRSPVVCRPYQV